MFRLIKINTLLFATLLLSQSFYAQHPSFESTLKTYKPWAITLSGGGNGLMFGNQPWDVIIGPLDGNPTTIDGTWTPTNKIGWHAGIGGIYCFEDPILIDRIGLNIYGSNRQITEDFYGTFFDQDSLVLIPDTIVATSNKAINIGASLTAYHTFTLSPDLFIETGLGVSYKKDFFSESIQNSEIGFPLIGSPQIQTISLEATVGVGVMMWKGRFLRLNFTTDLLQFIKKDSFNEASAPATIPWMMNDYRPYRVVLNYDIHFKQRGAKNCANPNHTEKARELFGNDMRGHRKAKNNTKKKKKKKKDIY